MSIILASQSPRRRELLAMLGLGELVIIPAMKDETAPPGLSPDALVKHLALEKAREVRESALPGDVIIAADTVVELDGEIIGKPSDEADARAMLHRISGRRHRVFTGVAVVSGERESLGCEVTGVSIRDITDGEIEAYIASGEPMDKAGAYGAQGRAAVFVDRIEGDFFNVVGLPLRLLYDMLAEFGVNLLSL